MCTSKLACCATWALNCSVLNVNDLFGTMLMAKGPRKLKRAKIWVLNVFPVLSGQLVRHLEKVRNQWKRQASRCNITVCWEHILNAHWCWPHEFWWLEQQLCINNMLPSTAHRKPICLLNGQSCPQIDASWGDSREWSPLQDLLYSQPSSCPLASGQQSDGWRDGGAVGRGRRWAWISGKLKDVKMEGKIRWRIDRKQEK